MKVRKSSMLFCTGLGLTVVYTILFNLMSTFVKFATAALSIVCIGLAGLFLLEEIYKEVL